jgi:hypothetical protein
MRATQTALLTAMTIVAACLAPTATDTHAHNVNVRLSRASAASVPQPYVSIVDSISLTVTPHGEGPIVRGLHLGQRDTTASFTIKVPEGTTRFDVAILSTNKTLLFAGTTSVEVDRDNFPVDIIPAPQAPVLAVTPDAATATFPPRSLIGVTRFVLYNRGRDNMIFQVIDTASGHSQCAPQRCFVPRVRIDTVGPSDTVSFFVDSIRRYPDAIPLSLQTKEGSVAVIIRSQ